MQANKSNTLSPCKLDETIRYFEKILDICQGEKIPDIIQPESEYYEAAVEGLRLLKVVSKRRWLYRWLRKLK